MQFKQNTQTVDYETNTEKSTFDAAEKLTEDSKKNQDTISSLLNKITSLETSVATKKLENSKQE